jgi:hypothetical protein
MNMKNDKLHNITSTGFKTPEHYFDTFEDKLFERLEDKESIAGIETSGYTVPKDYFNSIEENILRKIKSDGKPVISLKSRNTVYYIAGIAASLLVLVALFLNNGKNENVLTAEMAQVYFEERGINSYDLLELLSDTDLSEEDFNIIDTPYDEDNLETYLLENSDIETILD